VQCQYVIYMCNVNMWYTCAMSSPTCTWWRRPIGCLKLQVSFRKIATNCRALLQEMTYADKASCGSSPPCTTYRLLQCVAVCRSVCGCCRVLQCVAVCCSVLQCVAVCCIPHTHLRICTYIAWLSHINITYTNHEFVRFRWLMGTFEYHERNEIYKHRGRRSWVRDISMTNGYTH